MKRALLLLLSMLLLANAANPAFAMTTTEEKSRQYQAAISELEAYLENGNSQAEGLYGVQSVFDSLGGFEQSKGLYYYTTALIKLSEETYDFDLLTALELLKMNQGFKNYLSDPLKGSALHSVEELESYVEGREKQYNGDLDGAMDCYKNCTSYFDATERYSLLKEDKHQQIYDRALEMQNAGDLAGAYTLFSGIVPFDQSEDRKNAIVNLLGYVPESPTDNLYPVTDLRAVEAGETEITIAWNASAHARTYEVQFKASSYDGWFSLGETEGTVFTINSLLANTLYDFRVIACIGKIRAEGPAISVCTGAQPFVEPEPVIEGIAQNTVYPLLADAYDGHTYALFESAEYTWMQAEAYCEQIGGHLVTIKNDGEQAHIENLIALGNKGTYWIGGRRDGDGEFRWIDDNSAVGQDNKHWDNGQPDNEDSGRPEDYMQILRVSNPDAGTMKDGTPYSLRYHWNNNADDNDYESDFFSIQNVGFVCEWDSIVERSEVFQWGAWPVLPDGEYKIACFADERYYLDIKGRDIPAKDGTNVQLWYSKTGLIEPSDSWTIQYDQQDGSYRVTQCGQTISLDVENGSADEGTNVQVWTNNTTPAQKWEIRQNEDGSYRIKAMCSGKSLDISGGAIEMNTNIQQWSDNETIAQKWLLIPYDGNTYYVASDDVNEWVYLRSKPSKDESTIIMKVPKWGTVLYTGEKSGDYMGVKYRNKSGYIYAKYLKHFDHP